MIRHCGNQQKRDVRTGIQARDNGLTYDYSVIEKSRVGRESVNS